MPQLIINIPTAVNTRLMDAIAARHGYPTQIPNEAGEMVANPVTKAQFVKQAIINFIKSEVHQHERSAAIAAAEKQINESNAVMDLT